MPTEKQPGMPSLAPGFVLMPMALALIVVLIIDPVMASWLRIGVVVIVLGLILALLLWAGYLLRAVRKARQ